MIIEKPEYQEFVLIEILTNPILFAEFENNFDNPKVPWELTIYQKEFMADFSSYISITCGRATGKTVSLTELLLWLLINNIFPGEYLAYTVPNKVHMEPVFNNLVTKLRGNSFLRNFIDPKKGINASSFTIRLTNGAVLDCRIAGNSGTGANVVGMHTPFIVLDEAGYYPWGTWIELLPTLNTWTKGYRLITSGVPTGIRENNVLYYTDQVDDKFHKHRVSQVANPRYTEEDDDRNAQQYGGRDSEDYKHLVEGLHGSPTFAVFDRRLMQLDTYSVSRMTLGGTDYQSNLALYYNQLSLLPNAPDTTKLSIMGVDLGYTDPTAIIILCMDKQGLFKFHARIQLNKVPYPVQERIIDFLDTKFKPAVMGIDEGNIGKSTIQHLLEDVEYLQKNYKKRLVSVNFAGAVVIGKNLDGVDISERIKPYSTSVLQQYTNDHRIAYSTTDLEMVSELERMTYTKNTNGDIIYRTLTIKGGQRGEDHFTSALLCGVFAYHTTNELMIMNKPKRLFLASWMGA